MHSNQMSMFRLRVSCLLAILAIPAAAQAEWMQIFQETPGVSTWDVDWPEESNAAHFAFSTTMPGSWPKWNRMNPDFTDSNFETRFGDIGSFVSFGAPDPFGGSGVTTAVISFDNPLAEGTKMVVLDIDARQEQMALFSDLGPLGTPEMAETMSGVTSTFATWDGSVAQQQLTTVVNGLWNNDREAYIWDVSGMQNLTVRYSTLEGGGQLGFYRSPSLPIPEPGSAALLLIGLGRSIVLRRHRLR